MYRLPFFVHQCCWGIPVLRMTWHLTGMRALHPKCIDHVNNDRWRRNFGGKAFGSPSFRTLSNSKWQQPEFWSRRHVEHSWPNNCYALKLGMKSKCLGAVFSGLAQRLLSCSILILLLLSEGGQGSQHGFRDRTEKVAPSTRQHLGRASEHRCR